MSDQELIERLRNTPNWMREGFQNWKDNVRTYDTAPFEAADRIEQLVATNEALTKERDEADDLAKAAFADGASNNIRLAETAHRVKTLTKERDEGMTEALSLAKSLHEQFYQEQVPQWEPLEDVAGVISQIDNMVAGIAEQLTAARQDADEAETYAWKLEEELRDTQDRANAFATKEYYTEMRAERAEAKLAKAVELLTLCRDMFGEVASPSDPLSVMLNQTLAEIKGESHD